MYNYVNKCRLKEVNNVQFLKDYPRKRIELAAIEKHYELFNYQELYQFIQRALQQGNLNPSKRVEVMEKSRLFIKNTTL